MGPPIALPYLTSVPGAEQAGGKAAFALPVPLQMATTFAAMALGFGVVIGTAISPNLAGIVASAPPPIPAPTVEQPTPPASLGGGDGGPAPAPASPAVAAAPVSSGGGAGGGGGGGKKKKKKKKKKEEADTLGGVVVHVNPVAVSYAVASVGNLKSIHTASPAALPAVGTDLSEIPVRPLRNGTYAEDGPRVAQGSASSASFSGTVTSCADTIPAPEGSCDAPDPGDTGYVYTLSAVGSSVLVRVPSASATTVPKVGQIVTNTVQINQFEPVTPPTSSPPQPECDGDTGQVFPEPPTTPSARLVGSSLTPGGTATAGTLEAVIEGRCPNDGEMVLSADDIRESSRDLVPLTVGPGIDQSKLFDGQPVMVSFNLGGSGSSATLTINGIGSDHGIGGADDPTQGQGSLTR